MVVFLIYILNDHFILIVAVNGYRLNRVLSLFKSFTQKKTQIFISFQTFLLVARILNCELFNINLYSMIWYGYYIALHCIRTI